MGLHATILTTLTAALVWPGGREPIVNKTSTSVSAPLVGMGLHATILTTLTAALVWPGGREPTVNKVKRDGHHHFKFLEWPKN
ncbi:hypothetical protein DPMN_106306 [Dreissena polymorpha]|uniref:Uncharacterized protein n=1 Tax=Dreissena polymorpha TaxID=45954 RepID=A0A9D4K4W2_DREPO|nr:hypothetical protein DPMN_106306 [Dreissena polymorpha]